MPVDEVRGLVGIRAAFAVAVHVGQDRGSDAVALVGHQFAKGLELVIGAPLGELGAVDLAQQLRDRLAQGQR